MMKSQSFAKGQLAITVFLFAVSIAIAVSIGVVQANAQSSERSIHSSERWIIWFGEDVNGDGRLQAAVQEINKRTTLYIYGCSDDALDLNDDNDPSNYHSEDKNNTGQRISWLKYGPNRESIPIVLSNGQGWYFKLDIKSVVRQLLKAPRFLICAERNYSDQDCLQFTTTDMKDAIEQICRRSKRENQLNFQNRKSLKYTVDGISLGDRINFDSQGYRSFRCEPSTQFVDFIWCSRTRRSAERRGQYTVSNSILHAKDGTVVYVNRSQDPAYWARDEVRDDIQRLERGFGEQANIINMPPRSGFPFGTIALWGEAHLLPLDSESLKILATERSPEKGILVDFIGNLYRSAQENLPVYQVKGGAGFVWSASYDDLGRGTLRFFAVNTSLYTEREAKSNSRVEENVKSQLGGSHIHDTTPLHSEGSDYETGQRTVFEQLPKEIRDHATKVRKSCREERGDDKLYSYMQGIQFAKLDRSGSQAIIVHNDGLCGTHHAGANCTNRGCDMLIYNKDTKGQWRKIFHEHLHTKHLAIDLNESRLQHMVISISASDRRCQPIPGKEYTSGMSCKLIVTYRNGSWNWELMK